MFCMDDKDAIIAELRQTVALLRAEIAELKLQLAAAKKDSSTSSKPPSSDLVNPPQPKGTRKKRRRGGQRGHQRHLRELLPEELVNERFDWEIIDADILRFGLAPTDDYEIIQHIELLEHPIHVIEHRLRKYRTGDREIVLPDVPEATGRPLFGPRMLAMIGWLKSQAHCSYSTIETWMEDVLEVPVSRGYLAKLCNGIIAASLAQPYAELQQVIPQQEQLGSDETSFKQNGKKHWIWCLSAPLLSLFHIAASRSRAVLEELVGEDYTGTLNCDYYSANCSFAWNFDIAVQYCWAHLIRDIRFLTGHPHKPTREWAERLLDRSRRLFQAWHRRDEMTQAGRERAFNGHRAAFLEIVRTPPGSKEAATLAARFTIVEYIQNGDVYDYDKSNDYFRFLFDESFALEPTNNHSEQQIRQCVIDRKITQGTRSEAGERYHERMWTAIATCRKQNRRFYEYLHQALTAHRNGEPAPSLLPNPLNA